MVLRLDNHLQLRQRLCGSRRHHHRTQVELLPPEQQRLQKQQVSRSQRSQRQRSQRRSSPKHKLGRY